MWCELCVALYYIEIEMGCGLIIKTIKVSLAKRAQPKEYEHTSAVHLLIYGLD